MSDFIDTMARVSRERVDRAKQNVPIDELRASALKRPKRRRLSLHATGFDLIAEIKRSAPSAGVLNSHVGDKASEMVATRADAYARGGATAISVLTEPTQFAGDLGDLAIAARSAPAPIMRKDFLVDEYQIFEARLHDAGGVLLIARMLQPAKLEKFIAAAEETRQFVLLEIFGEDELSTVEKMIRCVADRDVTLLIGVNARDLASLKVDTDRFARLAPQLPTGYPLVAESGLHNMADVGDVAALGYRVALVGTALMRSSNPANTVSQFVDAGRAAARTCASK